MEDIKKLELRITELENQLKTASGTAANVDPEELKTFHKVSQQLGIGGCINECQTSHCFVCTVCHHCTTCFHCITCFHCYKCNECICGPCIINHGSAMGGGRFGSLG